MHFRMTATSKLTDPSNTLSNHNCQLSGTVLAKSPRNSTMITWKATVPTMTPRNIQLSNMPRNMFIFSISRLFILLNTWEKKSRRRNNAHYDFPKSLTMPSIIIFNPPKNKLHFGYFSIVVLCDKYILDILVHYKQLRSTDNIEIRVTLTYCTKIH